MDGIWPPPPELYQINVHRSLIKARKTLDQRLLRPLSSNLLSEVIQALRNRTLLCQYSTKDVDTGQEGTVIVATEFKYEVKSDLGFNKPDSDQSIQH